MKIYKFDKLEKEAICDVPDVFLDHPDEFESGGINYNIKVIAINSITEVMAWTVNSARKEIEQLFAQGKKLPLILVEEKEDGIYELHDGQHRYAAYGNIFPQEEYIKVAVFTKK